MIQIHCKQVEIKDILRNTVIPYLLLNGQERLSNGKDGLVLLMGRRVLHIVNRLRGASQKNNRFH